MGDLGQWFKSLPPMTRYWFGGTVAFSLLGRFGILQPYLLILNYEPLFYSFQVLYSLKVVFNIYYILIYIVSACIFFSI